MKEKLLAFVALALMATAAAAQPEFPMNATWKDSAKLYIRALKEGALVVRLQSRSLAIARLRDAGNAAAANNIMVTQREENLKIVSAFRKSFDFCNVYFIYADSTDAWLLGKHEGYFLNDGLEITPSITLKESFSLLAEEGNPHQPVAYDETRPNQETSERGYLNNAIVIYDPRLKLLKEPFPYYAQEPFPQNLAASNWSVKVQSLNKKLVSFYEKSTR